jgi:hypothetical protein
MSAADLRWLIDLVTLPALTAFGCVAAYAYCDHKGMRNSERFWKRLMPGRHSSFYFRADFLMSAIFGTIVGIGVYSPRNSHEALAAGLGWTAAFTILKHEGKQDEDVVKEEAG